MRVQAFVGPSDAWAYPCIDKTDQETMSVNHLVNGEINVVMVVG